MEQESRRPLRYGKRPSGAELLHHQLEVSRLFYRLQWATNKVNPEIFAPGEEIL